MENLIFRYVKELEQTEDSLRKISIDKSEPPLELVDDLIAKITSLKEKIKFLEDSQDVRRLLKD